YVDLAVRVVASVFYSVVGLVDAGDATGLARVGRAEGHGDRMVLPAARRVVAGDRSGRVVEDLNLEVGCAGRRLRVGGLVGRERVEGVGALALGGRVAEVAAGGAAGVGRRGQAVAGVGRPLDVQLDLGVPAARAGVADRGGDREGRAVGDLVGAGSAADRGDRVDPDGRVLGRVGVAGLVGRVVVEIGRASCRDRVGRRVGDVGVVGVDAGCRR